MPIPSDEIVSPDVRGSDRIGTLDDEVRAPFVDSATGDIGPVEDQGYVDPDVDVPGNDLLDEEELRPGAMRLPEGID